MERYKLENNMICTKLYSESFIERNDLPILFLNWKLLYKIGRYSLS